MTAEAATTSSEDDAGNDELQSVRGDFGNSASCSLQRMIPSPTNSI